MAGLSFHVDYQDLGIDRALAQLTEERDRQELMDGLGQLGESQTKRRIEEGGPGPNGEAWPAWSSGYAATRNGGQSLLRGEGALLDDIAAQPASGSEVSWGTGLIYAAVHQEGATIKAKDADKLVFRLGSGIVMVDEVTIPARPYLGISRDDAREMEETALAFIAGPLGGAA